MSHPVDPIEAAIREADLLAEEEATAKVDEANEKAAWIWLMNDPRGRRIARKLISASQHDDQFSANFGFMSWKFGRAAFVREQLIKPMREASLKLFHLMEREADE